MQKTEFCNLKNKNRCAILRKNACKKGVYMPLTGENQTTSDIKISRSYILQASDQKTPALNEKSRAVRMCLNDLRRTLFACFFRALACL